MSKSSVLKHSLNSLTSGGGCVGRAGTLRERGGGLSGVFRTGAPGILLGSFREEWKGDHGVPRLGEPWGVSLGAGGGGASGSSAIKLEVKGREANGRGL